MILSACGGSAVNKPAALLNAESYTNEGLQAFAEDDSSKAQQLFSRALILYQGMDNQHGMLLSHINLAEVTLALNEYPASLKNLDAATYIVKKTSLADIQSRITLLYSVLALKQNKTTLAESIVQPLLPKFNKEAPVISPNNLQLVAIAHRTKIAFVQNQDKLLWTQRYAEMLKKSFIKNNALEARLLRFQSALLIDQGDYQGAESNFQQALLKYKSIPSRAGIAVTLFELGELAVIEKRWQDARDYFNRAINVYRYLKDFDKVAQLMEWLVLHSLNNP
ncbi:MAG: tetratricopeptide repeat protein [Methyloprofundus sp.]|nr:tetratricopeptide repeat protein [Methyloprofundus sp.]